MSIGLVNAALMELRGLEPLTPSVQRRCSPKLSYSPMPPICPIMPPLLQDSKSRQTLYLTTARLRELPRILGGARTSATRLIWGTWDATQNITDGFCQCPHKARGPRPVGPGPRPAQWAILDLNQRPLPYQRSALAN